MNRKKDGYTFISTVLILGLIVIIAFYIFQDTSSLASTYMKEKDNIQASYYAESAVNIVFSEKYEDMLKDSLEKVCFRGKGRCSFPLDGYFDDADISVSIVKTDYSRDSFAVNAVANYHGIRSQAVAKGTMINEIYKDNKAVVNKYTAEESEFQKLREEFSSLRTYSGSIGKCFILDNDTYYIGKNGGKYEIYRADNCTKETVHKFYPENYVYISQEEGNLVVADNINLRGILDVRNLYLLEDLNLEGVMNLKDDAVSEGNSVNIRGMLFNLYNSGENYINADYDFDVLYNMGEFLPRFIKPRIYSLNKA